MSAPLPADAPNPFAIRSDGDGGNWVDLIEGAPGLSVLAELLETYPANLGDLDLVATLRAWDRIESWVAARHGEALGALLARADRFGGFDETAAVLAAEVVCTQRAAKDKLAWANTLGTFPAVSDALERGAVDVAKARAICDEALLAPEASAQQVADLGLTLAPHKTPPQLRRALRAAVIGLDPAAAAERAVRARGERRVEFHPLPDAMAMISAYLPASDAMAVKTALDALARTTGREDPRTFDQRRADYLGAIFHVICDAGEAPLHPDHADGGGPSVGASDADGSHADSASATSCERAGESRTSATGAARRAGDSGFPLWRRLATSQRQRPHLQVTVAAPTLLGLDDQPGELAGYGPIPADLARLLATDATWRALYTDRKGAVSAVAERTYRPGAVLARQVAARDRTCTFVGCSRPAPQCDLDHRTPFTSSQPAVEQTHLANLHALCRFHHNLKTLHGWVPELDPQTGVTTWTSPLGTQRDREPELPLPPWESWLADLDKIDRTSPCPCASGTTEIEPRPPDRLLSRESSADAVDSTDSTDGKGGTESTPRSSPPSPPPSPPPPF